MLCDDYSVLLIDDDADVLDAYTLLLEQEGYRVYACNNPFDARNWLQADWPSCSERCVYARLQWNRPDDVVSSG